MEMDSLELEFSLKVLIKLHVFLYIAHNAEDTVLLHSFSKIPWNHIKHRWAAAFLWYISQILCFVCEIASMKL